MCRISLAQVQAERMEASWSQSTCNGSSYQQCHFQPDSVHGAITNCSRLSPIVPHRSLQHLATSYHEFRFVPLPVSGPRASWPRPFLNLFVSHLEFVDHVFPTIFAESLVNRCQRNNFAGDGQGSKYLGRAPIIDICLELRTVSRIETLKGHELACNEEIPWNTCDSNQ